MDVNIFHAGRFGFVECRTEELATAGMQLDKVDLCNRHVNVGRPKGYVEPPGGAATVPNLDVTQMFSGAAAVGLMPGLPGSGKTNIPDTCAATCFAACICYLVFHCNNSFLVCIPVSGSRMPCSALCMEHASEY